jgi:hypothetical protein
MNMPPYAMPSEDPDDLPYDPEYKKMLDEAVIRDEYPCLECGRPFKGVGRLCAPCYVENSF